MQIRNVRSAALEIAATGQLVEPGDLVEVDDDLGRSLLEQPDNWQGSGRSSATPPDTAAEVIAWVGDDRERAALAAAVEAQRDKPRKSVTDHIDSVLNTSEEV